MKSKKISTLEAMRAFYIAEELLPTVFEGKRISKKIVENKLKKIVHDAKKISDKELIHYHMDHWNIRYYNYLNATWTLQDVKLSDCGVWPQMSKLPEEATYGSPLETAAYVQNLLDDKLQLSWATHRVLYIENLMTYADLITQYVPIILLTGGVIRKNHLDKTKHPKKMKHLRYDIEDGNNRAVALALLGKTKVRALVGVRIHKSDIFK